MNKETISEGNKLISIFIFDSVPVRLNRRISDSHTTIYVKPDKVYNWSLTTLYYHKSWDKLMPVVNEIGRLGYRVTIDTSFTRIYKGVPIEYKNLGDSLETTFLAVVEFIKWHNDHLMEIYNKGWDDEMQDLTKSISLDNNLELHAYEAGALDALAGDDVSSIDLQSKEDILLRIYKSNHALLNHKP